MPGTFCFALDDGALFALEDGACLIVSRLNEAGILGFAVIINGVPYTALRGVTIERRLNEVGSATVRILQSAATPLPAPGVPIDIVDRQTGRNLFSGTIDEPVATLAPGLALKQLEIRAVDGMRRFEDLLVSTADGVSFNKSSNIVFQVDDIFSAFINSTPFRAPSFNTHDGQFSIDRLDSFNQLTDDLISPVIMDFRGITYADALRAIVDKYNMERRENSVLHINANNLIIRAAKGTDPVTAIDAGIIESIQLDRDRQHQHTRQCVVSADTSEYTDTFNADATHYDIAQGVVRTSVFDLDTPIEFLPGVLWRFLTDTPEGYNYLDSGANGQVLVHGGLTNRRFYHAVTPILAGATTQTAYVYYAEWRHDIVRLRLGRNPTTQDNSIQFVPSVSPAMLGIDTSRRVIQRRMLTGSAPYELDFEGPGLQTATGNPAFSTGNAVWHDATSVIVDLNEPRLNYELATSQDTSTTRPDLRVEGLSRIVTRDVTSQDSNPRELDTDEWRFEPGEHRVYPPDSFTLAPDTQLEITYTARWEVEADVGGTLPIIRHTQAAPGATPAEAVAAALADIQRNAEPVDIIDLHLTLDAQRHVEPGERWTLPDTLLQPLGIDVDADTPAPQWIVDSVRIADNGDRLAYACRLTRTRHSSEYREYWQSLQA